MNRNTDKDREAFIAKAVDKAVVELSELRLQGKDVCDVAYIEGVMIEAAKAYESRHQKT